MLVNDYPSFWFVSLYSWFGFLQDKGWLISQPKESKSREFLSDLLASFCCPRWNGMIARLGLWTCKPVPSPQTSHSEGPPAWLQAPLSPSQKLHTNNCSLERGFCKWHPVRWRRICVSRGDTHSEYPPTFVTSSMYQFCDPWCMKFRNTQRECKASKLLECAWIKK